MKLLLLILFLLAVDVKPSETFYLETFLEHTFHIDFLIKPKIITLVAGLQHVKDPLYLVEHFSGIDRRKVCTCFIYIKYMVYRTLNTFNHVCHVNDIII